MRLYLESYYRMNLLYSYFFCTLYTIDLLTIFGMISYRCTIILLAIAMTHILHGPGIICLQKIWNLCNPCMTLVYPDGLHVAEDVCFASLTSTFFILLSAKSKMWAIGLLLCFKCQFIWTVKFMSLFLKQFLQMLTNKDETCFIRISFVA